MYKLRPKTFTAQYTENQRTDKTKECKMNLAKKTAFVTGGAQGLGKTYVQRFLEEDANVCFGDISVEQGEITEKEFQEKYGKNRVMFFPFDVTVDEKFKEAFNQAVSHFGNIDIFVNNAGILNEGIWEKMIEINYVSSVRGTQLAMDHMRKDKGGKGGRIINISSIIGLVAHPSMPVYCSTKHAIRSFSTAVALTEGLESEMGIELAVLCPDATNTDLMTKLDEDKVNGYSKIKGPMDQRMMQVSTVADALFSLLHKDSINKAILMVTKLGMSFQKMERVDLGKEWPIVNPTKKQ